MKKLKLSLIALAFVILTGCEIALGPRVKTNTLFVKPGSAGRVAEKAVVNLVRKDAPEPVKQDITGWAAMPIDHFEALMKSLRELEEKLKRLINADKTTNTQE